MSNRRLSIKIQGHIWPILEFDPGPTRCGTIHDGVALELCGHFALKREGSWVISYDDLKSMYLLATEMRADKPKRKAN